MATQADKKAQLAGQIVFVQCNNCLDVLLEAKHFMRRKNVTFLSYIYHLLKVTISTL